MAERAAIVTGASSGIGLAIAHMLGAEGYGLTVAGRRPDKLEGAVAELREAGFTVESVAGTTADEAVVQQIVSTHRDAYGRLDVLVNNAGIGIGQAVAEIGTKQLDIQLDVNLRAYVLFYRETADLLRAAAAETGVAVVVNTASIAGKGGQAWLSTYSATKAGVIGFTQAMNKELAGDGVKSCALCPGFVDTPMTDFVKGQVPVEEMITPGDIAKSVKLLLEVSPACIIPEIVFARVGEGV
jgi:NAD(P)-dependent dehydrogenase (short-subunit alcohol dehydrogenase family)